MPAFDRQAQLFVERDTERRAHVLRLPGTVEAEQAGFFVDAPSLDRDWPVADCVVAVVRRVLHLQHLRRGHVEHNPT